jgi:predicted RNA-binding Zn ribbon-like protein
MGITSAPAKMVSLVHTVPAKVVLPVHSTPMQTLDELPFVGGDVALDFVNSAELRGDPEAGDVLRTPADLVRWGVRSGLLDQGAGAADRRELRAAVQTRELLYRLFSVRLRDAPAAASDLEGLARAASEAYAAARLEAGADGRLGWTWDPARPSTVRHIAATAATELLGSDRLGRLKQCPGDHCGWLFLDATKRGNRRWCSMRECGQEAKSARRREPRPETG